MNSMFEPTMTVPLLAILATAMSARETTLVTSLALSLAVLISPPPETVAVLVNEAAAACPTLTVIEIAGNDPLPATTPVLVQATVCAAMPQVHPGPAAAGAVVSGGAAGVGRPGVRAGAATRVHRQTTKRAGLGDHDHRAACAAASAAIVQGNDARAAVGRDAAGSGDAAGADHDDGAAVASAARVSGSGVVAGSGPAAGSRGDTRRGRREGRPTEAAHRQVRVPGVAAHPACSAVLAPTAARVLVVGGGVRIGAATAGGRRCASGRAGVGGAADQVVYRAPGGWIEGIRRRPATAAALLALEVVR